MPPGGPNESRGGFLLLRSAEFERDGFVTKYCGHCGDALGFDVYDVVHHVGKMGPTGEGRRMSPSEEAWLGTNLNRFAGFLGNDPRSPGIDAGLLDALDRSSPPFPMWWVLAHRRCAEKYVDRYRFTEGLARQETGMARTATWTKILTPDGEVWGVLVEGPKPEPGDVVIAYRQVESRTPNVSTRRGEKVTIDRVVEARPGGWACLPRGKQSRPAPRVRGFDLSRTFPFRGKSGRKFCKLCGAPFTEGSPAQFLTGKSDNGNLKPMSEDEHRNLKQVQAALKAEGKKITPWELRERTLLGVNLWEALVHEACATRATTPAVDPGTPSYAMSPDEWGLDDVVPDVTPITLPFARPPGSAPTPAPRPAPPKRPTAEPKAAKPNPPAFRRNFPKIDL